MGADMVRVADRVWEQWRAASVEAEPSVVLILSSRASRKELLAVVAASASDAFRSLEADGAATRATDWSARQWSLAPAPQGVLLRIDEEPDDCEVLLGRIVSGLDRRGVEGTLDLFESAGPEEVPETAHLFECRLRVRGERYRYRSGGSWGWRSDPARLAEGVDAAVAWCVANAPSSPRLLAVGLVAPVVITPEGDTLGYVQGGLEAAANLGVVHLTSAAPDRFRIVAIEPSQGRISFVEGGDSVDGHGWRPSIGRLRKVLREASSWAAYGFVKRGSMTAPAQLGSSLHEDWCTVMHNRPLAQLGDPFEDLWAPDAFGIQLLGPGYAGRVPEGPNWHATQVGPEAVLLEHVDPEAWFAELFGPFGGRYSRPNLVSSAREAAPGPAPPPPPPEVVERARADFAEILFTDEIPPAAA
jgi:hypothetical protein